MHPVKAIANLFIDTAIGPGKPIEHMKLQKLVYISHGWNLAIHDSPLITDKIQAWKYGPVIPVLYDEFKNCGRNPITDHATDYEIDRDTLTINYSAPKVYNSDSDTKALVQKIWDIYGHLTGPQLSNLTHKLNTPWYETYKTYPQNNIPNDLIKKHFLRLANR